uniref:Uncharacterized protein n=1 Tax=Amphimedon queenslandica TaxID=400682 RepID=A0A1X7T9D7_AMPQE
MKKVSDIIFVQNKCSIKFVSLYESEFDIVFPYLLDPSHHSLKQLELDITFNFLIKLIKTHLQMMPFHHSI